MTDALWSDNKIIGELDQHTEKRVLYADALSILYAMQGDYETERASSELTINTLTGEVDGLTSQNLAQANTITDLTSQVSTLTDSVNTLQAVNNSLSTLLSNQAQAIDALNIKVTSLSPDVTVTIGATPTVSQFETGVTWINSPNTFGLASWPALKAQAASLYGVQSTHIFPFGNTEPWSKYTTAPANPAPVSGINLGSDTTPNTLANALANMQGSGALHMKVYGACWWMKPGLTSAQMYDNDNRITAARLSDWLVLVDKAARLALQKGVRWFSAWNELKGYWDGNGYDVSMNPGNATALPGYGYVYKRASETIAAAAAALGIPDSEVKIGGAYPVLRGRSTTASATTNVAGAWGYLDSTGYNAVEQFMANAQANSLRVDFISVDGADYNKGLATDGTAKPSDWYAADDFANGERYHDIHRWLSKWGKPIVWDEYYRYACKTIYTDVATRDAYDAVLAADFFKWCVLDGVKWAFAWGPFSINFNGNRVPGQFDSAGNLTPYGKATALFRTIVPGTKVYPLTASDNSVDGVAWDSGAILYNKKNAPVKVAWGNDVITLGTYEVRRVARG